MGFISRALQLEDVAPQWRPSAAADMAEPLVVEAVANETDADGVGVGRAPAVRSAPLPQRVPPLSAAELEELRSLPEAATSFSTEEEELLRLSIESLDYLGNWADPERAKDSIVLTCRSPHVVQGDAGPEFTCTYGEFTAERHQLHAHIIDRMLSAANRSADTPLESGVVPLSGGPPALPLPAPSEQHVYITVGVPGSGKDTVLKRYLHALGQQPLLDASADIIKEYLAAWGQDGLSVRVRENSLRYGPGKHLLHSQYLHRESILICDQVVEQALEDGKPFILEKTLFNLDHVLRYATDFRRRGYYVHLLGTHIQPLQNWRFLSTRMASGTSFGRYITKAQAVEGITRYQANLERLLADADLLSAFDSVHVFDVIANTWCVSMDGGRASGGGSEQASVQTGSSTPQSRKAPS